MVNIIEPKSIDFMKYEEFKELYFEKNDIVTIPIESIIEYPWNQYMTLRPFPATIRLSQDQ